MKQTLPPGKPSHRCGLFLVLYYGTNAVYQGYISKFYQQAGLSGVPLMLALVALPAMAVLMQPIWGIVSDRANSRNNVLRAVIGVSALLLPCYLISRSIYLLLPLSCLFAAFYTSIQPMGDSIILEDLRRRGADFGPVRLCGCLSFAFINLILGGLLKGRYRAIPLIACGGIVLMLASACLLPKAPGHQHGGKRMSFGRVLRLPHIIPLMLLLMLLQMAMGYFYSYFTLHFTALAGGTSALLGAAYFVAAVSELPFLLLSDKLFRRFGAGRLMLWSALVLTLRFALLGFTANVWAAFGSQLFHSGGFIIMTVSMAKYIDRVVPDELKSSGQMLLSMIGFGVARVFGVIGGGVISELSGSIATGFIIMSGVCLVSLAAFTPVFLRLPPLNGEDGKAAA